MLVRSLSFHRLTQPGAITFAAIFLGLLFFCVSAGFAVSQHLTFHTRARDMGIWTQALWSGAQGRPLETTLLERDTNLLAEHVELLLLALVPLGGLAPDPLPLLILQQLSLALCGLPIYVAARARLTPLPALVLLVCFYLMPAISRVSLSEYHSIVVAALPVAAGLACVLTGRARSGALLLLLAMLMEEEVAPTVAGLGGMLAIQALINWRRRAAVASAVSVESGPSMRFGLSLFGLAVAWTLMVVLVVLPSFRLRLPAAGEAPNRAVSHYNLVLQDPSVLWVWLTAERGPDALAWLLLPNGGLALLAPEVLLVGLPSFLVLFLQDRPGSYAGHWSGPLLPVIWLATAVGLGRLLHRPPLVAAALGVVLGGTALAYRLDSYFPGGRQFQADHYQATELEADLRRAVDLVPPQASLIATRRAVPHLITRRDLYQLPLAFYIGPLRPDVRQPDFHVLDLTDSPTRQAVEPAEADSVLEKRPRYHIQRFGPSVLLLSRARPEPTQPAEAAFGGIVRLTGLDWPAGFPAPQSPARWSDGPVAVRLFWDVPRRPSAEAIRLLRLLGPSGEVVADQAGQPVDEYLPVRDWERGQVVVEQLTLRPSQPLGPGTYRLVVGWSLRDGRPLPVEGSDSPELELARFERG